MKEKMIKQYARNSKGVPIGVLVAVLNDDGNIRVGWSLCHKSDQFSKERGTLIAENRARSGKLLTLPETLNRYMSDFAGRAIRYFYPETVVI